MANDNSLWFSKYSFVFYLNNLLIERQSSLIEDFETKQLESETFNLTTTENNLGI